MRKKINRAENEKPIEIKSYSKPSGRYRKHTHMYYITILVFLNFCLPLVDCRNGRRCRCRSIQCDGDIEINKIVKSGGEYFNMKSTITMECLGTFLWKECFFFHSFEQQKEEEQTESKRESDTEMTTDIAIHAENRAESS